MCQVSVDRSEGNEYFRFVFVFKVGRSKVLRQWSTALLEQSIADCKISTVQDFSEIGFRFATELSTVKWQRSTSLKRRSKVTLELSTALLVASQFCQNSIVSGRKLLANFRPRSWWNVSFALKRLVSSRGYKYTPWGCFIHDSNIVFSRVFKREKVYTQVVFYLVCFEI